MDGWVVKVGGSLAGSAQLPHWLAALATAGAVIVPGGGPFADQVRALQRHWGFADGPAHRMAILAMAQYGTMLAALQPVLETAGDLNGLSRAVVEGRSVVWLPEPDRLPVAEIEADWDLTSDSLAAWLAGALGRSRLLLVKSTPRLAAATATALAAAGVVDPRFPDHRARAGVEAWLAAAGDHHRLAAALGEPAAHFTAVLPEH